MLQIGICDDSQDARLDLRSKLESLLEARSIESQIFEFSAGERLLSWLEKHRGELDLIFLDIEMGRLTGMETAKLLRQQDSGLQLVFVTGFSEYVYDGYSVGALGYLLKPAAPGQLSDILLRALSALSRDESQIFLCRNGESMYRIQRKDILYFASDKRTIQCVTQSRTYTFYDKLDQVEKDLADETFVRIHQRYLVHAPAVDRLETDQVTLQNGETFPISRSCKTQALVSLTRAMLK